MTQKDSKCPVCLTEQDGAHTCRRVKPVEQGKSCERPVNPVGEGSEWSSLAFTKREWDLINMALLKSQLDLISVFTINEFNYVYKWTKNVGSRP